MASRPSSEFERAGVGGDDEDKLVDLSHLLAPRGLSTLPGEEHWRQACDELPMPALKAPEVPGLWVAGRRPGDAGREYMKRVRQRAWELANAGQIVNTTDSAGAQRG